MFCISPVVTAAVLAPAVLPKHDFCGARNGACKAAPFHEASGMISEPLIALKRSGTELGSVFKN